MLKGLKDYVIYTIYLYIQYYVERVKRSCYVETRDVFAHNFLNIKHLMVWLESPKCQLPKHFWIENQFNIKKVMSKYFFKYKKKL